MKLKKDQVMLGLKGFSMGMADIVPGVSGGTVALITGVYDDLIKSISSVNKDFITLLFKFKIREALEHLNFKFLFPLVAGILTAVISMSRVMHYFMSEYSVYTWSLFFGLILASIIFIGKTIKEIGAPKQIGLTLVGAIIGYAIVSLIPVETSNAYPIIFCSGAIAICAMILPGISGSFILLILGKYLFVTSALKNPFVDNHLAVIFIFAAGCLVGLLSFSKLLNYLLSKFHNPMMCVLLGFMIGSMRKIWPWKDIIEQKIVRGKVHVLKDAVVWPQNFDSQVFIAFGLMFFGIVLVFAIEKFSKK